MPIRSFEHLVQQHRSCQFTEGTQILQDTRLGIEGLSWLKRILNTYKEPIMTALGGCAAPLGLKSHIVKELEWFKAQRIQPIFVFPGITQTRKSAPFATEDTRPIRRNQGWEYYNKGQRNLALTNWSGNNVVVADLMLSVFDILDENGVEFLRSPYGNLAQLSYFVNHPRGYVHAVWCSTDLLMYNVDKVITSIDFERNSFKYMDKQALLNSLQITDEQFLDICLLAGDPNLITTFPPMSSPGEGSQLSFSWANIMDLIRTYGSGFNIAQAWAEHPTVAKSNYIDTFCRTRASVKHHIILSDDGQIEPLNKEYAPSDMHEVIGYRLPDEIYYYLSVGLISPQVINNLVSGTLIETAPLCNGETEEYRKFLQDLLEVRTQTLGLLTQPLNQYYQTKKVNTSYYFAPTTEHPMPHSSPQYIVSEKLKWHVNRDVIDQDMKTHDSKSVDLLFCVKALKEPKGNKGGKKGEDGKTKPKFESRQEILANVTWKALQLRGLVDQSHALTPLGKAFMHAAAMPVFTQNSTNSPSSFKFYEELFIALELINAGMLNGTEYSRKYDITVRVEDDKEKQHITLITRALSLLNVQLKSVPWNGPVNRDLLCFNSIVKALQRTLRNLFEMLALNMCLNDEVKKDRDDYLKIALSLPFHKDTTTALGVIAKSYLEALADSTVNVSSPTSPTHPTAEDKENSTSNGDRAKSKEEIMKMLEAKFDFVKDVREELNRGLTFWNQLVHAVKKLREHKLVTEEVAGQFKAADAWLNTRV